MSNADHVGAELLIFGSIGFVSGWYIGTALWAAIRHAHTAPLSAPPVATEDTEWQRFVAGHALDDA
jgi:hypothetical protein